MASQEFGARASKFWAEREKQHKQAQGITDESKKPSRSSLFGRFSKVNVEVTIRYRVPDHQEDEYQEEFREARDIILRWFPKHVTVKEQQLSYSSQASGLTFDILIGKDIVHTNTWMQQGKFSTAGSNEKEFVKRVLADSISGKEPNLKEYQKIVKAAKDKEEDRSMREAKDAADLLAAEKKKQQEAKRARLEARKKTQEEEAKRKAEEEAAKVAATKVQEKAKSKTKTKAPGMTGKTHAEARTKAKEQDEISIKIIDEGELDGINTNEETRKKNDVVLANSSAEDIQTAAPQEAKRPEEVIARDEAGEENTAVKDAIEFTLVSDSSMHAQHEWEGLEESCTPRQDKASIKVQMALDTGELPPVAQKTPSDANANTLRVASASSGFLFFCCSSSAVNHDVSGDAPAGIIEQ